LHEDYGSQEISYYFNDLINLNNEFIVFPKKMPDEILKLFRAVFQNSIPSVSIQNSYPLKENKLFGVKHKKIESEVNIKVDILKRDNYSCMVCDFNFLRFYGHIGTNIGEIHLIQQVSIINKNKVHKLSDFITICPNCHRIIHLMEGKKNDYKKLRKIIGL
jgi:predicted HNH restriction endonuclease